MIISHGGVQYDVQAPEIKADTAGGKWFGWNHGFSFVEIDDGGRVIASHRMHFDGDAGVIAPLDKGA